MGFKEWVELRERVEPERDHHREKHSLSNAYTNWVIQLIDEFAAITGQTPSEAFAHLHSKHSDIMNLFYQNVTATQAASILSGN
jgi:hypothetical protein